MKPAETLAFFENQIARGEKGFSAAKVSGNSTLLALNVRQLFKARLMRGLVMWRQSVDPTAELSAALNVVRGGLDELSTSVAASNSEADLPLARAALVAALIGRPSQASWNETSAVPEKQLDRLLLSAGGRAEVTSQAEIWLASLAEIEGAALAVQTYRNYFEILERASAGQNVEERIDDAERAFGKRALDRYYVGAEQTEGGGQDNALVVDYRLALVLRRIDYRGDSIHRWRWNSSLG